MEEEVLRQISNQLGDLLAMYRLVNRERITKARNDALGDGTKRKLWELCDGSKSQADLAKALNVSQQRVSQVMAELAEAGIVARNSDNRWIRRLE